MKKLPFTYFVKQQIEQETINNKPHIIISKNIITESIFKKSYFQQLFNLIQNISKFRCLKLTEICNYLPLNWKIRLNLLNGSNRKNLLIFNISYSLTNISDAVTFLVNDYLKIPEIYQKDLINDLIDKINSDNSNGCYFTITNITKYGILFLNKPKITDEIFIHKFIHYYQDVTGKDINDFKLNFNKIEIPQNLNLFLIFNNNEQLKQYLNIIMHQNQLIPYINNLIFQLKKFFNNKTLYDIKFELDNLFKKITYKSNEDYILRIYNLNFCKYLINNHESLIPLLTLILCNIYDKNILTFKNHIYSAF